MKCTSDAQMAVLSVFSSSSPGPGLGSAVLRTVNLPSRNTTARTTPHPLFELKQLALLIRSARSRRRAVCPVRNERRHRRQVVQAGSGVQHNRDRVYRMHCGGQAALFGVILVV